MSDPAIALIPVDDELAGHLAAATGADAGSVTSSRDANGTLCLDVPLAVWTAAATFVRDRCGLDFFDWLSAVDQPDGDPAGLDVVVHVADSRSSGRGRIVRMLLRTRVPDASGHAPSLTGVWAGAAWHERETFEMFGLLFDGFDDGSGLPLRPLLLPDGFEGTPLRKSFVLAARASKPWPGAKEPGESAGDAPSRRKTLPPGVPDPAFWPRETGAPKPDPAAVAAAAASGPPARGARPPRTARPPREPGAVVREPRAPRTPPPTTPDASAPDGGAE